MIDLVKKNLDTLSALCSKHGVKKLSVFGSAKEGSFDPSQSDLDFCVEFGPMPPDAHADAYFGLLFALEDLFGRRIDLVEKGAVTNPYFLKELETAHEELYAA